MKPQRVLVAGIGNVFCGDDAFGVEVVQRLMKRTLPEGVAVVDFGIRGFDLAYALMDGHELAIMVDAMSRGGAPGTLYVIEPDLDEIGGDGDPSIETHGMHPLKVLHLVRALGGRPNRLLVVGCEPEAVGSEEDDWQMGLSESVAAVIDEATDLVESLIAENVGGRASVGASQQRLTR